MKGKVRYPTEGDLKNVVMFRRDGTSWDTIGTQLGISRSVAKRWWRQATGLEIQNAPPGPKVGNSSPLRYPPEFNRWNKMWLSPETVFFITCLDCNHESLSTTRLRGECEACQGRNLMVEMRETS